MTQPNLFNRTTRTIWRWLFRWRRILLGAASLWAALLVLSLLGVAPGWLDGVQRLLTESATLSGRLLWFGTALLFGAAALIQLAERLPGWRLPPADWITWQRGACDNAPDALRRLKVAELPLRLGVARSEVTQVMLSTSRGWLSALSVSTSVALGVTLVAVGIVATQGWTSMPVEMVVGQSQTVATRDATVSVALVEVRFEPQTSGPARISVRLAVTSADGPEQMLRLAQGETGRVDAMRVRWVSHGAAYRLQATDATGAPVLLRQLYADKEGATLRIPFDGAQQEKWASLVDRSMLLRMVLVPDDHAPYLNAQLIAGTSGEVLAESDLVEAATLAHDEIAVEIIPEAYVVVSLADASHRTITWLALGLLGLGAVALALTRILRCETVWVVFTPPRVRSDEGPIDGPQPPARWLAGGSAAQGEPPWLEDVVECLTREEPER